MNVHPGVFNSSIRVSSQIVTIPSVPRVTGSQSEWCAGSQEKNIYMSDIKTKSLAAL